MPNPFGTTFESLENPAGPVVESVHEAPYRRLCELIDSGEGQLISLRALRAGYGKTMLLSRLREKKKGSMTVVPIHLADGRRVEGERILEEFLTQLVEGVPGLAGLTKLDLHARRLFAHGLLPLVYSGEVPSQDKEGALDSLRERPTEAFDFHNEGAAIAQWTKSQFEVLLPRLSSVLSKASGATGRDTSYWITLLFQFAIRTPNEPSRVGDLIDTVFGNESRFRSGAGFLDGLGSFLNLITLVEPAVLVLDEVDGLSSDCDSALRATSCLVSLWESSPRMSVIISVNDDVWESAFAPRLPLGLRDRLEDVVIRLNPLTAAEARSLIAVRSGDDTEKVLRHLNLDSDDLYPRGVLRAAREAWEKRNSKEETPKVERQEERVPGPVGNPSADFSAPAVVEPIQEVTPALFSMEAPAAQPKPEYPPKAVRRAAIPRRFDVQRIRPEVAPVLEGFAAPPALVAQAPVNQPPAFPEPASQAPLIAAPFAQSTEPLAPAAIASPFQVSETPALQGQYAPPPARPGQPSPFEAAQAPAQVPHRVPSQEESPFAAPPELDDHGSLRVSPFDPAPTQAPIAPPQAGAPPTQVPPVFAAPVAPTPSPFEANRAPQEAPRQPEAPKADSDAIDELLRQFREHRDS
ncbi:MAG: hypothetical protein ACJAQT_002863 [Akkermansiaceae bacterium]|jgi:hypothetical protein